MGSLADLWATTGRSGMETRINLVGAVEPLGGAPLRERQSAFRESVWRIRQSIRAGSIADATAALRLAIAPGLDYTSFQTLYRLYKSLPRDAPGVETKVA